jgi:hypothetical protein
MTGYLLATSLVLQCGIAGASGRTPDTGGWQQVASTTAGRIYHRDVEQSSIPMVMIETTFRAGPARVHAVVTDYDHFAAFIPNVSESRVLRRDGDAQWVFHHLHFPGPVSDRAYILKSTDVGDPGTGGYRVEWRLAARRFPDVDLTVGIQPRVLNGFWEIRPSSDETVTAARYAVHSDPGGMIPAWLTAAMTDRYVQQVTEAVRERLLHR